LTNNFVNAWIQIVKKICKVFIELELIRKEEVLKNNLIRNCLKEGASSQRGASFILPVRDFPFRQTVEH